MEKTRRFFEIVTLFIGLIGGVIAVYQSFKNEDPELSTSFQSIQSATTESAYEDLQAKYYFNGREVKKLWVIDFSVKNTGSTTLIGKGPKSSLMSDSLSINVGNHYTIIKSLPVENTIGELAWSWHDSIMELRFQQWRPDAYFNFRFFVEGDSNVTEPPAFSMYPDEIINGKIVSKPFFKPQSKSFLEKALGNGDSFLYARTIAAFILLELMIFIVLDFINFASKLMALKKWKGKYFEKYIESIKNLRPDLSESSALNLKLIDDQTWDQLQIPKPAKILHWNDYIGSGLLDFVKFFSYGIAALYLFPFEI